MGYEPWNEKSWWPALYPGDAYVDWVAVDAYRYSQPNTYSFGNFDSLLNGTKKPAAWPGFYNWDMKTHPNKPLMLAEWGVYEYNTDKSQKPQIINSVYPSLSKYPNLKAMVYFDALAAPTGNTAINSSPAALSAFRSLTAKSIFDVNVNQP
jgi:beta-mannanase